MPTMRPTRTVPIVCPMVLVRAALTAVRVVVEWAALAVVRAGVALVAGLGADGVARVVEEHVVEGRPGDPHLVHG
jgi:hypothetical protein